MAVSFVAMTTPTTIAAALLLALAATSCFEDGDTLDPMTEATNVPATTAAADPYNHYLELAATIPDAPDISRGDAQLRAMLGCGTAWAPGTVDAALALAYADLIEQWETQGLCGPK